jgi:hypothetical protein
MAWLCKTRTDLTVRRIPEGGIYFTASRRKWPREGTTVSTRYTEALEIADEK